MLLPPENRFWCRVFNFQKEATVSSSSDIVLSEERSGVGVVEFTETSLSTSFFIQKLKCEDIFNCDAENIDLAQEDSEEREELLVTSHHDDWIFK